MRTKAVLVGLVLLGIFFAPAGADAKRPGPRHLKYQSELIIQGVSTGGIISGQVSSPKAICVNSRLVRAQRNNITVGSVAADASGRWSIPTGVAPVNGDLITALVDKTTVGSGPKTATCSAASNNFVVQTTPPPTPVPTPAPTATPAPVPTQILSVSVQGVGTVTSTPAGISCREAGTGCASTFPTGTFVTLTATPDAGRTFGNWGLDCASSTTNTCTVAMNQNRTASAVFNG